MGITIQKGLVFLFVVDPKQHDSFVLNLHHHHLITRVSWPLKTKLGIGNRVRQIAKLNLREGLGAQPKVNGHILAARYSSTRSRPPIATAATLNAAVHSLNSKVL
jgi:hypothetical protein